MTFVVMLGLALLLAGCGEEDTPASPAAGRYRLDRRDYARRLVAERLAAAKDVGAATLTAEKRTEIQQACIAQARALTLSLELRADGAFLARYAHGKTTQRLAGSWEQAGSIVTFTTTHAPSGSVGTVPPVQAEKTAEGLRFGGELGGWAVPHEFLLRPTE